MAEVVLCSASPRRRELLAELCPRFRVCVTSKEEHSDYVRPHLRVMDLARGKLDGAQAAEDDVVIASDTLVYRAGKYYGKPHTEAVAREMLRELSGKSHSVYTGVAVRRGGETRVFYDRAIVVFKALSDEDIERYIAAYRPLDKAGAYGVQDGVVVARYKGSYSCIMGLPTERLGEVLQEMGVTNVQ